MVVLFHTLFPVFGLIFLGYALVRFKFFDAGVVRGLNNLTYWVGLPAMLIHRLVTARYDSAEFVLLSTMVIVSTILTGVIAWVLGRLMGVRPTTMGTFLQCSLRGNLAFIGLPVIGLTFLPFGNEVVEYMQFLAILTLVPIMIFYNLGATTLLILSHPESRGGRMKALFRPLITNPIIISSFLGIVIGYFGIPLPDGLIYSLQSLGGLASPLALLCIGCSLYLVSVRGSLKSATLAAGCKTALCPLIGLTLALIVGLSSTYTFLLVVMLACPTATVSFILTRQLGGDEALASSSIVISSLLCLVSLSVILLAGGMIGIENFVPAPPVSE